MKHTQRPKKISAIIFDLDGTLLNTLEDLATSMNVVLKRHQYKTYPINRYKIFIGEGIVKLAERSLAQQINNKVNVYDIVQEFVNEYENRLFDSTKTYNGIPLLLDKVTKLNIPMAILSNKRDYLTQKLAKKYFSKWPFKIISGAIDGIPKKPDPTLAIQIVDKLNVPAEECLVIGDTPADMEAALKAGMFPVGVLWGFRNKTVLSKAGAKILCKNPKEVFEFIAQCKSMN